MHEPFRISGERDGTRMGGDRLPSDDLRPQFEVTLGRAIAIAWRRKIMITLITGLAVALALVAGAILPRIYESEALILLTFEERQAPAAPGLQAAAIVQSEADIVRSTAVARRVVDALAQTPEVLDDLLGIGPDASARARDQAVLDLRGGLAVTNDDTSYIINVGFSDTDPARAALIANLFADEYIESRIETSYAEARRTSEWLAQQVDVATDRLEAAERRAADFRAETGVVAGSPATTGLERQLSRALDQLASVRATGREQDAVAEAARTAVRGGAAPDPAVLNGYSEARRLASAVSEAERAVVAARASGGVRGVTAAQRSLAEARTALNEVLGRVVPLATQAAEAARADAARLSADIEALQMRIREGQSEVLQAQRLEADIEAARANFERVREQYRNALALADLKPINATLVSRAEPLSIPTSPNMTVMLALGLVAGLALSAGAVLALELRDRGFDSEEALEGRLGLFCAGMVPAPGRSRRAAGLFDRAVTRLLARLDLLADTREVPAIYVVTSALPDEGAAELALALAATARDGGRNVVVVGTRASEPVMTVKPRQRRSLFTRAVSAMRGRSPAPSVPERDVAQRRVSDREFAAVFDSPGAFDRWLEANAGGADLVVVAAPPVLTDAQAEQMAIVADLIVFTVGWRAGPTRTSQSAVRQLAMTASGRKIAAVLTNVDVAEHRRLGARDSLHFLQTYREKAPSRPGPAL